MLRPRDLAAHGIPREYLSRLSERGVAVRAARGLYVLADAEGPEHHTLAEVCKRVSRGVLCLLFALRFHGLTTQVLHEVWIALDGRAWRPRVDGPAVRIVRFSGPAFESAVETPQIEGLQVKVYSPAKTVADCFKYRNTIGLDVALEVLRDCPRQRMGTVVPGPTQVAHLVKAAGKEHGHD